ncbi:hypothetical protein V8E55_005085 [Tylopilus felleus]
MLRENSLVLSPNVSAKTRIPCSTNLIESNTCASFQAITYITRLYVLSDGRRTGKTHYSFCAPVRFTRFGLLRPVILSLLKHLPFFLPVLAGISSSVAISGRSSNRRSRGRLRLSLPVLWVAICAFTGTTICAHASVSSESPPHVSTKRGLVKSRASACPPEGQVVNVEWIGRRPFERESSLASGNTSLRN